MHTVQITDPIYDRIQRHAAAQGLTVEAYIETAVETVIEVEEDELNKPLTPELMAKVELSRQQIREGKFYTSEQVSEKLAANREAWQTSL